MEVRLKDGMIANDVSSTKMANKIRKDIMMLGKQLDVKMTNLATVDRAGKEFTIPKVPTSKDMEALKASWEGAVNDLKREFKEELWMQTEEVVGCVRQTAFQVSGNLCGICELGGHVGENCPKFDPAMWCRVCGSDYHLTKNCVKEKRCNRCRSKDSHCDSLHEVGTLDKKLTLIKEYGDSFRHFLETGEEKKSRKTEVKKSSR